MLKNHMPGSMGGRNAGVTAHTESEKEKSNMKSYFRKNTIAGKAAALMLAVLMVSSTLTLSGCGDDSKTEPQAVSVIIGAHANSAGLNLNTETLGNAVRGAAESFGFISVISSDGNPSVISSDNLEIPDRYKNANMKKIEADAQAKASAIIDEMAHVQADDPETDPLKAITLAVRTFENVDCEEKTIIVLDTGLATAGLLDMRNNLLSADPKAVAEELDEKQGIPDLSGISVKWQQMGDLAGNQQELSPAQRNKLTAIWKNVIEMGGGTFEASDEVYNEPGDTDLPPVSEVELPEETPVNYEGDVDFTEGMTITDDRLGFSGDSAALDREKAEEVLSPVAEYMKENKAFRLILVGTTAGDEDTEYTRVLSTDRAEAVKAFLVECGISEGRIETKGMGCSDPWHISGAGTGDNELAAQNRKVVLLDAASDTAAGLS